MAPKKKKGAKEIKAAKFVDKEHLRRAEVEILTLQQLSEDRAAEALDARRRERTWRERMDAYGVAIEQQREDTLDITSDMLRQYKAMQDKMMRQIDELEASNSKLRDELKVKQETIGKLEGDLEQERNDRAAEVNQLNKTIEQMQGEFAEMLKDTLDKMYDKLDMADADYKVQF
mmetsp:Transcript_15794/g.44194  ORF Transcript_15794/g.44194 Transcript_15794/m.44194 type:complete len:174 (+) Transcript_15794:286-807(+)